jgi:hypothetical protein
MEQMVTWKSPGKIVFFLASLLLLGGLLVLANLVNPAVHFADPNLEKAIREKIDQPTAPLSRLDLLVITELDASGRGIKHLEGIEALRRLAVLNLADNTIADLSPLARLSMLSELNLQNNQISDLESINFDQITHLPIRSLNLRHNVDENQNKLSNISLLSELSQIEVLDLRENHIDDIGYLASLTNLRKLDLRENRISDIESLSGLQALESLNLRENHISDIDPLRRIYTLQELNIRENRVEDIEPLAGLTNLTYLNIHSNPVKTELDALSNLQSLQTLIMRNVVIGENFQFLGSLTKLQRLNIRNSSIADVSVIGDLLQAGALQDNAEAGVYASIDLLEIDPAGNGVDPYLNLRRYWGNISSRYPINLPYYPSLVKSPVFSHQGGFYEKGFYLTLFTEEPDGTVYYTLDGSEPLLTPQLEATGSTQEYIAPILIDSRPGEPNPLSIIETSKGTQYIPPENMFNASVVRVVVVDNAGNRSNVLTQTYFVDEQMYARYTFPVVSIVTDADNLFDDEIGIYVPGNLYQEINIDFSWWYPANFTQRGLKWERPVFFQLFSSGGEMLLAQNVGIRIHGGATRYFNPKSFRLYAKNEYDQHGLIQYDFFPELNGRLKEGTVDSYETLIFRNGGNDAIHTLFRDALAQSLLESTRLDIQGYQPAIIFINGEYWGIHNIRARYDEHYFQAHYGIAPDELLVLENGWDQIRFGNPGNGTYYSHLFSLIDENYAVNGYSTVNTLFAEKAYQEIAGKVDIDNFISYHIAQIFFDNGDWPQNNVLFWRKTIDSPTPESDIPYGHDGKWRWMMLDVDSVFDNPDHDNLARVVLELDHDPSTYLLRSLLENEGFRYSFINQFADHLNTIFREQVVVSKVDEFETLYSPEIEEHIQRWGTLGGSHTAWLENVDVIRQFALARPTYQRQHILEQFNLPDLANLNLRADPAQGHIRINTINIQKGTVGVDDPANWSGIYFQGVPIKITAVPAPGYRFVGWKETGSKEADLILMLTEDITLTAEFEKAE